MFDQYFELAATETKVLPGQPGKQLEVDYLLVTCDTAGASITIADDNDVSTSRKYYLNVGINEFEDLNLVFVQSKKLTVTATGGAITVTMIYNVK